MILSEAKVKKIKSDTTIEGLIKLVVSQQETQDKNLETALSNINKSLESVSKFALQISKLSSNEISNEGKILSLQQTANKILKETTDALTSLKQNKPDFSEVVTAIKELASSVDQTPIVDSLKDINKNLGSKNKEWNFSIIRDQFDRIDKIKAISQ